MELLSVRLVNIRSFGDVTIDFGPGVVRIAGENGAGKSTIVGGISFAFIGAESVEARRYVLNTSGPAAAWATSGPVAPGAPEAAAAEPIKHVELDASSKLLRRGESWGLVAVTFRTARAPDRVFRIHRVLGKRPKPRGRAPDGAARDPLETEDAALVALAPGGLEVLETQKKLLASQVAGLLDLPVDSFVHAFKRIVAAPQGKLLQAIFDENRERRDIYWKILGVDRYASAASDATRMGRLLEERHLGRVHDAVTAAEQEVKDLAGAPELASQLEGLVSTQTALVTERRVAQVAASSVREGATETVARSRERAAEARRLLDERIKGLAERDLARKALAEAEDAGRRVAELAPAVARFEALRAEQPSRERALAAFETSRGALEQARQREAELRRRDETDARRHAKQLADAVAGEASLRSEADELAKRHALAERETTTLAPEVKAAAERRESFARWLGRFEQPLERLVGALALPASREALGLLDDLARSAPRPDEADDVALVGRATEVADLVSLRAGAVGEAKARLESSEDLATKVGSGAICPFLTVACPHPRGANLLETMRESAGRDKAALVAAQKALEAAQADQTLVRAAQQRLERQRVERQGWLARVARAAPSSVAALEAWDRDRAELGRIAAEAGERADLVAARDLVAGLVRASAVRTSVPLGSSIGQGSLFERARAAAVAPFVVPAEWDGPSLVDLARVVRGRRSELEGALVRDLDKRLVELSTRVAHEASELETRLQAATLRREKLRGQLEAAPARLAELAALVARLRTEEASLVERHRADAAARTAEVAARLAAHAALEQVPVEHQRYVAALEDARKADAEARRLGGMAEHAPSARERVERALARVEDLRARAGTLAAALAVACGLAVDGVDPLAPGALEQLGLKGGEALGIAEKALDASRRAEEASVAALLDAEKSLVVLRTRLDEARRRAVLLGERRGRVERLREAHDHVAHACSVLRGGPSVGRLSGALYRALSELPARLAERRVHEVSTHARRIYRTIAPNETWDLLWDPKSYVLALGAPGMSPAQAVREGIAIDDMSGGQQMCAALALHLALVHTYARNCDVLFLDEPTTHLDAKRRRALAETLRSLRSQIAGSGSGLVPLRQVFLISHDDAFEGLQDQVIRVIAGDGERPSTIEGTAPRSGAASDGPGDRTEHRGEVLSPAVAQKRPKRRARKGADAPT